MIESILDLIRLSDEDLRTLKKDLLLACGIIEMLLARREEEKKEEPEPKQKKQKQKPVIKKDKPISPEPTKRKHAIMNNEMLNLIKKVHKDFKDKTMSYQHNELKELCDLKNLISPSIATYIRRCKDIDAKKKKSPVDIGKLKIQYKEQKEVQMKDENSKSGYYDD